MTTIAGAAQTTESAHTPIFARLRATFGIGCKAEVGPIPKLGGHTCRCNKVRPHRVPHTCDCGSWFEPLTPPGQGGAQ